ncbi:MAG: acyltransferase family protein [Pirellula sp.]
MLRNIGLDLLRLVAVVLVIARHGDVGVLEGWGLSFLHTGGWVGVDLFFVISGFLVSSLLFKEYRKRGRVDIRRFLIRRGFKIYPAFYLFLAVMMLFYMFSNEKMGRSRILVDIFFVQNYFFGLIPHAWSLAVEEHFYLALSVLIALLIAKVPKNPLAWIPPIVFAVAIGCLLLRILTYCVHPEYTNRSCQFPTHLRIDSLFFGVLISYGWVFWDLEKRIRTTSSAALLLVGAAALSPAFIFDIEDHRSISIVGFTLFYLGSGLFVLAAMRLQKSSSRTLGVLASLGAASYSTYLWHMAVMSIVDELFGGSAEAVYNGLRLPAWVVGACVFGWVMNRAIEIPMLKIRNRLFPAEEGTSLFASSTSQSG